MQLLEKNKPWLIEDIALELSGKHKLALICMLLLGLFFFAGTVLQFVDPTAGVLDVGLLSVFILGMLAGLTAILCSLWLQEILWQPFKAFRGAFNYHFNQLSSWQQCIVYFSVFFLLLYALLSGLAIVF